MRGELGGDNGPAILVGCIERRVAGERFAEEDCESCGRDSVLQSSPGDGERLKS